LPLESDNALVDAVLAQQPGAFERLVKTHERLCWHVILRLVRQPEDARELCQEAFLRVHRQLHQFRFESQLRTWIGRVAYSVALRHLERKRLDLVELDASEEVQQSWELQRSGLDTEANYADTQTRRLLLAAIDTLAPQPRTILMLYHLEELSIPEISQITGLAVGTIKSHLFRSRLKLRELLQDWWRTNP
jgi:RNA polymerase sigma factor (sigma-70 family)